MIGIVVSRADGASVRIGEALGDLADWAELADDDRPDADGGGTVYRTGGFEMRRFDDLHLRLDGVAAAFDDPEFVVFVSRHSGGTGPLLTAHFTGNLGPAEFGGSDGDLARACPAALRRVVAALGEHAPPGYDVGMECTHHGPSAVGAPSMFVEVGSAEPQWEDPDAARAVARAVLDLRGVAPDRPASAGGGGDGGAGPGFRHLAWFGGGHYAPRPLRVLRETGWAVGHVAADWALDDLGDPAANPDPVAAVFEESPADYAVVEGDRPGLEATVADLGYRVVSETWVRETDGVPPSLVAGLEDALCTVDDGLRFGNGAADHDGEFDVVALPADLLTEARGIDADRVRQAVAGRALAFETAEAGNRVVGRAAVAGSADREALVDALVDVLRSAYESVERDGSEVVATESAFDPERARDLGVPEGPAFGRLADGQPVEVDGRQVPPSAVTVERTRWFAVDPEDDRE